ncbi:MAG: hypothetical protein EP335_01120 [Alphaproteobacteria bacterium]|nr:MAG: hypothetical protein EP335_01120 [Alphaproteobacteria bacterium]
MPITTDIRRAVTGMALAAAGFSLPAIADHENNRRYEAADAHFRAENPIRVFVEVDAKGRRADREFENIALHSMGRSLPPYVRLVSDARRADLVISADEDDYDVDFRVVDRDREHDDYNDKHKYKSRCRRFETAYYTEIKEKGEAEGRYTLKTRMRHHGTDIDRIRIDNDASYTYTNKIEAKSDCGMVETNHAPNQKVKDMLARSEPGYRDQVARDIRRDTAEDLGRALASRIARDADRYYAGLSRYFYARAGGHYRGNDWYDDRDWDRRWDNDNDHHGRGH